MEPGARALHPLTWKNHKEEVSEHLLSTHAHTHTDTHTHTQLAFKGGRETPKFHTLKGCAVCPVTFTL